MRRKLCRLNYHIELAGFQKEIRSQQDLRSPGNDM
jgi:hypothetical protein